MTRQQIEKDIRKIYLDSLNSHKVGWVGIMMNKVINYIYKLINK